MCIILDASIVGKFNDLSNEDAAPVRKWIESGKGSVVYAPFMERGVAIPQNLAEYNRLGRLIPFTPEEVKAEQRRMERSGEIVLSSDDPHVLALARISGARLLFTDDLALRKDFKNRKILGKGKRGQVYSKKSHKHLLTDRACVHR